MAAYRLKLHKDAARFLHRLPAPRRRQVRAKLDLLALDPRDAARLDVRPMRGEPELWRLRVGKIRAIYEIQDDRLVVYVITSGTVGMCISGGREWRAPLRAIRAAWTSRSRRGSLAQHR